MTPDALNARFGIPGKINFAAGQGGLTLMKLTSDRSTAEVYLHGAHVAKFQPRGGKDLLWMSGKSWFENGKPIRGGVPVCFPWFGNRASSPLNNGKTDQPGHGFVRLKEWDVESVDTRSDGRVSATLVYRSGEHSHQWVEGNFEIRHVITIGQSLQMSLVVRNLGPAPFTFEEALHTYFSVGDIRQTIVRGLENREFLNTPTGSAIQKSDKSITFESYTDSVYAGTDGVCTIEDRAMGRRIVVDRANSATTVVWNPWTQRAKEMPDFGDDEWPGMLCVETANARAQAITLGPGAQHLMRAVIYQEDGGPKNP